jgi:hypothetical protein
VAFILENQTSSVCTLSHQKREGHRTAVFERSKSFTDNPRRVMSYYTKRCEKFSRKFTNPDMETSNVRQTVTGLTHNSDVYSAPRVVLTNDWRRGMHTR